MSIKVNRESFNKALIHERDEKNEKLFYRFIVTHTKKLGESFYFTLKGNKITLTLSDTKLVHPIESILENSKWGKKFDIDINVQPSRSGLDEPYIDEDDDW